MENEDYSVNLDMESMYKQKYAEQRNDRLAGVMDDFMMDEDITPADFYKAFFDNIQERIAYHQKELARYTELNNLFS